MLLLLRFDAFITVGPCIEHVACCALVHETDLFIMIIIGL